MEQNLTRIFTLFGGLALFLYGMDALGQVDVTVEYEGRIFHGMGLSTDVIESSALALLHAINNIERAKRIHAAKKRPSRTVKAAADEAAKAAQ